MKKILALALALIMVLGLATTVSAADADLSGHTYTAYKIFAGTQAEGDAKLAVTDWGEDVDGAAILTELQKNALFKDCKTANDVAAVLTANADFAGDFAKIVEQHLAAGKGIAVVNGETSLGAGYYLIVDTTEDTDDVYEAVNLSLLQLTNEGTFEIKVKVDVPEVQKKVKDTNDSEADSTTDWQDSADHDIGDNVPFQLTATLPTDLANYDTYTLIFHDIQSAGLTFNDDAKVYVVNGTTKTEVNTGKYSVTPTATGFDVNITDVLSLTDTAGNNITVNKDCKIVVEYTAKLNEEAEIGYKGNPNKVYLQYSNNPNYGGEGDLGKTPEDKVIVFTYKLDVNKVDQDNKALKGAGFTLYKYDSDATTEDKWAAVGPEVKGENLTTFVFKGLDDGKYKLVETTVPDGYNKAADVEFEISATHDVTADDPKLTNITINNTAITAEQAGEDDAKYYTGILKTDVVNKAGTTLPETGGMGTTLFYAIGGLLVAAAVVLLVTKKRMASAE